MKNNYEKHQRDYSLLAMSIVTKQLFSKDLKRFYSMTTHPIYILVENGILSHFADKRDYQAWGNAYFDKINTFELIKYEKETSRLLPEFRKFLSEKNRDLYKDFEKLQQYNRVFLPMTLLTTYVPMYGQKADKKFIGYCLEKRKKYEDVHKKAFSLHNDLLLKLERELKLTRDTLGSLIIDEFNIFLKSKVLPRNVKMRNKFVFIECSNNGFKIFNKKEAIKKLRIIDPAVDKAVTKFKGSVAYPGKVRGKVRIIELIKDAGRLKSGEILVASMTDPRYVPSMKRAAAIITDEGGITCHAAIVSRELKKPCIIGTEIATKVLKDGDSVEVDAEQGIIKLLK